MHKELQELEKSEPTPMTIAGVMDIPDKVSIGC